MAQPQRQQRADPGGRVQLIEHDVLIIGVGHG